MQFAPIPRKSLSDALYEQLLDAIVDGEITPGEALPAERVLAEQAGVNRQAVREALQRLRRAGLITVVHGGGAYATNWRRDADVSTMPEFVADSHGRFRLQPWSDLGRLRNALCLDMAVLACRHATDEQIEAVAAAVAHVRQLHDVGLTSRHLMEYEEIWTALARASANVAYRMAQATFRHATGNLAATLPADTPIGDLELQAKYDRMIAALRARSEPDAVAAARAVLRHTGTNLVALPDPGDQGSTSA